MLPVSSDVDPGLMAFDANGPSPSSTGTTVRLPLFSSGNPVLDLNSASDFDEAPEDSAQDEEQQDESEQEQEAGEEQERAEVREPGHQRSRRMDARPAPQPRSTCA